MPARHGLQPALHLQCFRHGRRRRPNQLRSELGDGERIPEHHDTDTVPVVATPISATAAEVSVRTIRNILAAAPTSRQDCRLRSTNSARQAAGAAPQGCLGGNLQVVLITDGASNCSTSGLGTSKIAGQGLSDTGGNCLTRTPELAQDLPVGGLGGSTGNPETDCFCGTIIITLWLWGIWGSPSARSSTPEDPAAAATAPTASPTRQELQKMVTLNNTAMNDVRGERGLDHDFAGPVLQRADRQRHPRRHDADLRQRRRQASSGPVNGSADAGSTAGSRLGPPRRRRQPLRSARRPAIEMGRRLATARTGEAGVGAIGKLIAKKQKPSYDARHARNRQDRIDAVLDGRGGLPGGWAGRGNARRIPPVIPAKAGIQRRRRARAPDRQLRRLPPWMPAVRGHDNVSSCVFSRNSRATR